MNIKQTLFLAMLGAVSIGIGAAAAQDSASGCTAGYDKPRFLGFLSADRMAAPAQAPGARCDLTSHSNVIEWPALEAADGNGS